MQSPRERERERIDTPATKAQEDTCSGYNGCHDGATCNHAVVEQGLLIL